MVELRLPKNSKIGIGKVFYASSQAKNENLSLEP